MSGPAVVADVPADLSGLALFDHPPVTAGPAAPEAPPAPPKPGTDNPATIPLEPAKGPATKPCPRPGDGDGWQTC